MALPSLRQHLPDLSAFQKAPFGGDVPRGGRRPHLRAGQDERMAPPGAELKNDRKQEDQMPCHQLS
jgi:hypothetical protein